MVDISYAEENQFRNPSPRFTGIFIPVEILEIEELSLLDQMLLSWIDALYSKKYGGCFASNEYLASRLRVKENTIAKSLIKLRDLGLIETVSFDGRHRVMKSNINKFINESQSKSALDYNPSLSMTKIQPRVGEKSNPSYIYTKEERKEYSASPKASALVVFFLQNIRTFKQDFKEPDKYQWAKEFDLMLGTDKRDDGKIREVIAWLSSNEFWRKNILSPSKLREKFDQLELCKNENNSKNNLQQSTQTNEQYCRELEKNVKADHYSLTVLSKCVEFTPKSTGEPIVIEYIEKDFKSKVNSALDKLKFKKMVY